MPNKLYSFMILALIAQVFASGCHSPESAFGPEEFLTGETAGTGGMDSGSESDDGDSSGFEEKFDASSGGFIKGCDKIDFLFVIDRSSSMQNKQVQLAASFPGFIAEIQKHVSDFRIMVVDTGALNPGVCADKCAENPNPPVGCESETNPATCSRTNPGCFAACNEWVPCYNYPNFTCADPLLACDEALGAGVVASTAGDHCGLEQGRYMDQDQPDLSGAFQCVANRGIGGDANERPMESMIRALNATQDPFIAGTCNAGFLREDAMLVVTFITDEDDGNSGGDPYSWMANLLAVKREGSAVVVLGLFADGSQYPAVDANGEFQYDVGGNQIFKTCGFPATPRLTSFMNQFSSPANQELLSKYKIQTFKGPVCHHDYVPFFAQAAEVVNSTCSLHEK